MLLDLLFEVTLQFAQELQVGMRMEALNAPEIIGKKAIQKLLFGAVEQEPDIEELLLLGVGNVPHQVIRAGFQAAFICHKHRRISDSGLEVLA